VSPVPLLVSPLVPLLVDPPEPHAASTEAPSTEPAPAASTRRRHTPPQPAPVAGSSSTLSSETYHGPRAFSATETQRLRDFVLSRRVGGVQQIKASIDFHTYSELVLWPYGYTMNTTAAGLGADQQKTFAALGAYGTSVITAITAQTYPSLPKSIRVMEKCGLAFESEYVDPDWNRRTVRYAVAAGR